MTAPALVFLLVVAFLVGSLYHFIRGGSGWRLLLYICLSAAGFAAGQWLGWLRGWSLFMLGSMNLGMGAIGALLFLIIGEWLSRIDVNDDKTGV